MSPAVAPHPDVNIVQPLSAAVTPIPLRVGRGASETVTQIVLEAVWNLNSGVPVAANQVLNEWYSPQHVHHWADVEAGQPWVPG
jgi:hypothetical protein